MTNEPTRGIYSDAYLFDIASEMIDRNVNTLDVAAHLIRVLGTTDDKATEIIAAVWGP